MPEMEIEREMTREEAASFFRKFASGLEGGEPIDLDLGGTTVTIDPTDTFEFEVELEDESSMLGRGERSIEFELEWKRTKGDRKLPS